MGYKKLAYNGLVSTMSGVKLVCFLLIGVFFAHRIEVQAGYLATWLTNLRFPVPCGHFGAGLWAEWDQEHRYPAVRARGLIELTQGAVMKFTITDAYFEDLRRRRERRAIKLQVKRGRKKGRKSAGPKGRPAVGRRMARKTA